MKLAVYNTAGESTGAEVTLPKDVFEIEPNDHAIYLDVKRLMASRRQGTHSAKERNAITGSRKKIKKQKGTGTARAGDIKNPLFRGGGRVFGPKPRSYDIKLNSKVRQLARKSALSYKALDEKIKVLDSLGMEAPKTKDFVQILGALEIDSVKSLFLVQEKNENAVLSSNNLPHATLRNVSEVTTYDVLNADTLVITKEALGSLEGMLKA